MPAETVLFSEDFSDLAQGSFGQHLINKDNITLAKGAGKDGSDAIEVLYVGYERGSERVVSETPFSKKVTEATLSFDVKFDQDFQWVEGGKFHGLGPLVKVTGGKDRAPEKWSARMMFEPEGRISTYLYDQDMDRKWGHGDITPEPVFQKDVWHHITFEVVLNDVGKANGSAKVFIDGEEVLFTDGVEYRGRGGEDTLIQHFLFSTFHGGNNPSYTPVDEAGNPTTVKALYDNFKVIEGVGK